ncbi:hypothetical protein [Dokdonella fugitiva]|uniref:Secreted protein (IPTL-CTERM system target) n=2 Tax=Dokdonella fugitiva TaxID=328517 RepID=A0A4R2HTP7_9GAMM|nr:hypothetical protein [Dokdonella fugitiva]TCO34714.1 hypothetical protein EV148_1173 [Dokdonella fugitiva]
MLKYCYGVLVIAFLLAASTNAQAFWDPPIIAPTSPTVGQVASVNIRLGDCDVLIHTPGYPQVTQTGTQIKVVQWGQHWEPGELCTFPTGSAALEIGSYPPGQYTVSLDMRYRDFFSDIQVIHLGDTQFTVAAPAGAPSPAPSLGIVAMGCLIVLLLAAVWRRKPRARSPLLNKGTE